MYFSVLEYKLCGEKSVKVKLVMQWNGYMQPQFNECQRQEELNTDLYRLTAPCSRNKSLVGKANTNSVYISRPHQTGTRNVEMAEPNLFGSACISQVHEEFEWLA